MSRRPDRPADQLPLSETHLGEPPRYEGVPLLVVAQVLGHSDTRMVEKHYGHLAPSYVRDAVRATSMDLGAPDVGNVTPLRPAAG